MRSCHSSRQGFLVEQALLKAGLVLHELCDDLIEVFLTDALRLGALGSTSP
jgi:hypothetical protein